ncbi:uncharacterized protein LOC133654409, partial [Entelurus aequoreus]|uniref:uncharacterized protein LOC133654409 n=1 Tax=Entelurus aequoreus TaxID=161455 RepID=UPI002B1DE389
MATLLPGFAKLSPLVLHLLLLGSLFALTPPTAHAAGASDLWTPGPRLRDAGKASECTCEPAWESPEDSRDLPARRWSDERTQREGCSGARRGGMPGARKGTPEGFGTFRRSGDELPPPPLPGVVSAGKKGVVPPATSEAFSSSPVQSGKKRTVQRTRVSALPRPHLTKRGAHSAFVRAFSRSKAPGSRGRINGGLWEEAGELSRHCKDLKLSPEATYFPGYNSASYQKYKSHLNICMLVQAFCQSYQNKNSNDGARSSTSMVRRRAGNRSHLGRHRVIGPRSIREGGE